LEFFFDVHGGSTIGALWEPSLTSERAFRVLAGFSSQPIQVETPGTKSKTSDQIVLNRAAVLAEIERLGAGLVKTIVVRK
jgi:U3 small nucleolar RNA-associated protein 22